MDVWVVIQAAIQVLSAALYFWVARIVLDRAVEGESRRANALFATWWLSLGVVYLLLPAFTLPARAFGYQNLALATALLYALFALIALAVWGLVYYLVYLYTGNARWFWPITAFYIALAFSLLYLVAWLDPSGFDASGRLTYTNQQLSPGPSIALGLAFSGPVILSAIGYGSLYFQARDPSSRYRIALVSGAFLVQFGWSLASSMLQLSRRFPNSVTLSLIGSGLAIAAALAIVLAFRPPPRVRARLAALPEEGW